MTYAANTEVPADRSRAEIERTLQRYGADQFMYGWSEDAAVVQFRMNERVVKFLLPMPDRDDPEFRMTPAGKRERTPEQQQKEWERATRSRWRALALVVKAKLEAVESGITEFDDEFLAHIILPDGSTAGQWLRPQLDEAYRSGRMPSALPALGSGL